MTLRQVHPAGLAPRLLLALAWALAAGTWLRRQLTALAAHDLQWAQDLAFFNQIFHSAAQGGAWSSPLLLEPQGFFDMVHLHLLFVALVPLYALLPGPGTLLAFNVLAVSSAAWPVARLGERASGQPWFGLGAGLALLAWWPMEAAAGADFRPMAFWVPGLAWLLLGVYARSRGALALGLALVLGAREEAAYVVPALGAVLLVLPFGGWRRREGLALLGIGVAWLGLLLLVKGNFFFHFDPTRPPIGDPPPPELARARLDYLGRSLLGGYALAPLSPAPLAMSLAPLAWLMPDALREWHLPTGPYVHLRSALLPLFAVAGTVGAGALARRHPRAALPLALAMVLGNAAQFGPERAALAERARAHEDALAGPEVVALDGLVAAVPPEARVVTDYRMIAALSGRTELWNARHLYLDDGRPPHWTEAWPLTLDRVDAALLPVDDPLVVRLDGAWTRVREGGGYALWLRSPP